MVDWKTSGIYGIFIPDGVYVGSSKRVLHRWSHHKTMLKQGSHLCAALQSAYDQGIQPAFTILHECEADDLLRLEAEVAAKMDLPLLNRAAPGSRGVFKRSAQTKRKTAASITQWWITPERQRRKFAMLECLEMGMSVRRAADVFRFSYYTVKKWRDAAA